MEIVFLINNMNFSGGRRIFLEYASWLMATGRHKIRVLTLRKKGDLKDYVESIEVPAFNRKSIGVPDLIVATTVPDVSQAVNADLAPVVHFCQGFEIDDLCQRVNGQILPERYKDNTFLGKLRLERKKMEWKALIKKIDSVYRLDTFLATISPHLVSRLEERYGRPVSLVKYGVHNEFFFPDKTWKPACEFSRSRPCRILSVAPKSVTFKGIPTTIDAIRKAKLEGLPIHFTRITPDKSELNNHEEGVVDKIFAGLAPNEVAQLMRKSDLYISNSTEGEGFGLPAMEALSCGVLCILSAISSYKSFSDRSDYCLFVPEMDSDTTVNAIKEFMKMPPEKKLQYRQASIEVSLNHTFDKSCESFEKMLTEVVERKKQRRKATELR